MRPRLISRNHQAIAQEVEKGLNSIGKIKILRLLMKNPTYAFTRYKIRKSVPLDPTSIRNDLKLLVKIGWVIEFKIQNLSKYSLNQDNEIMRHLLTFFRDIRYV